MRAAVFWLAVALVFIFAPKSFDTGGMIKSILATIGVLLVVTPPAVYWAIMRSLPEHIEVTNLMVAQVPADLERLVREYEIHGFKRVLPPMRFHLPNPAVLVAMMDPDGLIATAYKIESAQMSKLAYDVVSVLGAEVSVTTGADHSAGVLPGGPGDLRQIFQGAIPEDLILYHREALRSLAHIGIRPMPVSSAAIPGLIKRSFVQYREVMEQRPVGNTLVAIYRTVTKRNPHMGMLMEQNGIAGRLQELKATLLRDVPAHAVSADVEL